MKIILLILMINSISRASIIFNPFTNNTFEIKTPKFLHTSLKSWSPLTIPIIPSGNTVSKMSACEKLKLGFPLNGLAVVVIPQGGCDIETHAEVAKKAGASAVFVVSGETPNFLASVKFNDNKYNQTVPILMINTGDFLKIITELTINSKSNSSMFVLVTVEENTNTWKQKTGRGGMIFFQVFTITILAITLIIGIRVQIFFTVLQGVKLSAG
eukprot:TRINITY_DN3469_c0_g1_i2.p1 TRINITY_DN3469_c0_g1~~TRINITY_DN3469_c0_g1_i2.p1  ORF type:complete len:213 (-),score=32.02 TRINITY_DN3469_c0_g1_i2:549-1187(-)